jgi:hypothetical protein
MGTSSSAAAITVFNVHCLSLPAVQNVTLREQNDKAHDASNSEQDQG